MAAGELVHAHDDCFPQGTPDAVWLAEVGRHGWIVLTKDKSIRYRQLEIEALISSGVGAFVLTSGDMRGEDMGAVFVAALPRIRRFLQRHSRPFVATLSRAGVLTRIK